MVLPAGRPGRRGELATVSAAGPPPGEIEEEEPEPGVRSGGAPRVRDLPIHWQPRTSRARVDKLYRSTILLPLATSSQVADRGGCLSRSRREGQHTCPGRPCHPAASHRRPATSASNCLICAIFCGTACAMTTTVEELMRNALDARRAAQNAIRVAVREARAAEWSWDRISAALGGSPNGETLRRNFGGGE